MEACQSGLLVKVRFSEIIYVPHAVDTQDHRGQSPDVQHLSCSEAFAHTTPIFYSCSSS